MANDDNLKVVEVTTPTGRHYQLRISPDKPIIVRPIFFGKVDSPLPVGSEGWQAATETYLAQEADADQEPIKDLIGEARCKGTTHKVYKVAPHLYSIFVDGVLTQRDLTADEFVRWACNALEDGS